VRALSACTAGESVRSFAAKAALDVSSGASSLAKEISSGVDIGQGCSSRNVNGRHADARRKGRGSRMKGGCRTGVSAGAALAIAGVSSIFGVEISLSAAKCKRRSVTLADRASAQGTGPGA